MSPIPFTKLNSVTYSPQNESLALNGDNLYIISKGVLYKHSISQDSLISSSPIAYKMETVSFNDPSRGLVTS